MAFKVVLLGVYHESNTFIDEYTVLEDFKNSHWLFGEEILKEYRNAFHEIGGMLEVMDKEEITVIPLMFADATPGGAVSDDAY